MNRLFMTCPITFTPTFVVWLTKTMRQWDGKRKTCVVPSPIVAAIYPCGEIVAGKPFKGWTSRALFEGRAARWYGAPVAVFASPKEAKTAASRIRGWFIGMLSDAEVALPSGGPDEYMPF